MIVCELGLFGGAGVIAVYALIAARGFKTAVMARTGSRSSWPTGPDGRVRAAGGRDHRRASCRFIPLTGVTLPFVSFGGSSVIANMILLALLLMISNDAPQAAAGTRSRRRAGGAARMNTPIVRLYGLLLLLFAALVGFTSYWAVFDANDPQGQARRTAAR